MNRFFDCVDGNMVILMYDNTIKKIKDVKVGDEVYAVKYDGDIYQYIRGVVTGVNRRKGKAFKVTLSDGRSITSTPNHQWLTQAGWLYTHDDQLGNGLMMCLSENVRMSGIAGKISKSYGETPLYMEGYFVGAEIYGKNLVQFRSGEVAEFVFVEEEVTRRIYNYLLYFGVDATMEDYFAHNNDTNEFYVTKKLNIPYKQLISFSKKFGKNKDKEEFLRGFLAGVYDADGTVDPYVKSVKNSKKEYFGILKEALNMYGFEYLHDKSEMTATLLGGPSELIRFYYIFIPVTARKLENMDILNFSDEKLRIASIEEVKSDELFELTTTARNFIANGIVSHNCASEMGRGCEQ